MKLFFVNIWKYFALVLTGIVAGLVYAMNQIKPVQNVSATEFINQQSRDVSIGKIKQRGEGNSLDTSQLPEIPTRREKRIARRAARRELRLEKETQTEVQDLKDP